MPDKNCVEDKKANRINYWVGGVILLLVIIAIVANS